MQRLFGAAFIPIFSLLKCGVYKRAAFQRGNTVILLENESLYSNMKGYYTTEIVVPTSSQN